MATVPLSKRFAKPLLERSLAAVQYPEVSPSSHSIPHAFSHFGHVLLGIVLFLLGSALVITLWLMPVGLPLALLGLALIAAPEHNG